MDALKAKEKFVDFLKSKITAVIATTSSSGQPMAATIYFDTDEDFNVYFITKSFTRKYKNIEFSPEVGLVVGTENEPATIQIQGRAERITDVVEVNARIVRLKEKFFKNDYVAPLFQMAPEKNDIALYKITPTWIRWLDLRGENIDSGFVQII